MSLAAVHADSVGQALYQHLHEPVAYALSRPGKGLRSLLLSLGCQLAGGDPQKDPLHRERCELAAELIEQIHAGSLIIDDIEDQSVVRRNAPTLHMKYGIPRALNAGNWLYFSPLTRLAELRLPAEEELQLYRDCMQTLANAHCGQALDIGTNILELPQAEVAQVCRSSMEWKTGELTGLALRFGGYAAGAMQPERDRLHELGVKIGVGLQMLDDVSNFSLNGRHPMNEKRLEDLRNARPSWVWSYAARQLSSAQYAKWVEAVRLLPDETKLWEMDERYELAAGAKTEALRNLRSLTPDRGRTLGCPRAQANFSLLIEKIGASYG